MRRWMLVVLLGLGGCGNAEDTDPVESDADTEADTDTDTDSDTDSDTDTDTDADTDTDTDADSDTDSDSDADADADTDSDADTDTEPTPLSYAADIQPIFDKKCTTCHSGTAPSESLTLTSAKGFSAIVNHKSRQLPSMDLVEPGDTAKSYLWHKIAGTQTSVGGSGVKMPKGSTMTSTQKATIEQWILDGANP
jgi:hypothetical protein